MEGVEPPTLWFVAIDSNPLSYIPSGGRRELNPRMMVPQTITLPLGDARHYVLYYTFFLPGTNDGSAIQFVSAYGWQAFTWTKRPDFFLKHFGCVLALTIGFSCV